MITVTLEHDSTKVTVKVENHSEDTIDCFFLSDFIPDDVDIVDEKVLINGVENNDYIFEHENAGIYEGRSEYRWIMDVPLDCGKNQIRPGDFVEIEYKTTKVIDDIIIDYVGYIRDKNEPFFGYNL